MPRILRVINRFNVGGITYNVAYLSRYLPPDYMTRVVGGIPMADEAHSGYILDQLGVAYEEIPTMRRSINPINDWRTFRQFRRIIREFRPDIVHTHAAKAGIARLAAWMEGVPVIVHTFHGNVFSGYFSSWKTALIKVIERFLAKRSTAIVAISPLQKQELSVIHRIAPPEKVHVIRLGFDLRPFTENSEAKRQAFRKRYGIADDVVAIGIIGRFAPVKNHKLFLDMFHLVHTQHPRTRAFVAGDGQTRDQLMAWAHPLQVRTGTEADADVTFISWSRQIDEVIAGLDMVVITSFNEGTPVSLIEAQAAGRSVVSTNVGGVSDIIDHGVTGFIADDFTAAQVARYVGKLVLDPELRRTMGSEARQFALHHYNYERLVCETDALYRKLLEEK